MLGGSEYTTVDQTTGVLYTIHYTLYTIHCTLYTVLSTTVIQCNVQRATDDLILDTVSLLSHLLVVQVLGLGGSWAQYVEHVGSGWVMGSICGARGFWVGDGLCKIHDSRL